MGLFDRTPEQIAEDEENEKQRQALAALSPPSVQSPSVPSPSGGGLTELIAGGLNAATGQDVTAAQQAAAGQRGQRIDLSATTDIGAGVPEDERTFLTKAVDTVTGSGLGSQLQATRDRGAEGLRRGLDSFTDLSDTFLGDREVSELAPQRATEDERVVSEADTLLEKGIDFATEIAEFTKQQVLLQAGTSVLGNANQIPQLVLSLLG